MFTLSEISKRLNEALSDKNITKAELARRANITRQALNSYLVERTRPSHEVIVSLANVLGVNPAWLDGYEEPKYKSTNQHEVDIDDDDVIFTYEGRKIPKEDLEMIKRFMRGKE